MENTLALPRPDLVLKVELQDSSDTDNVAIICPKPKDDIRAKSPAAKTLS